MSAPSIPQLLYGHWEPAWPVSAAAILSAAIYVYAAVRAGRGWRARWTASFLAGVACVVTALESGIAAFDDRLLSVHMVQHMLLLLLGPLLLLGGRPGVLALRTLPPRGRAALARAFVAARPVTGPLACLVVFNLVVLGTHLPAFYDATLSHPVLHEAEHALYLLAGLLLWWPVVGGELAGPSRLGGLGRFVYVLAAMPVMAVVGAYLDRHPSVVYAGYRAASHQLGVSAVADQQDAGAIMWVAGSVVMVVVAIWAGIAGLLAEERRQQARDARAFGLEAGP